MRQRQNEIVDYIHGKDLVVIANGWDPDDIFVKESGTPTTISSGDYYMLESYVFSSAAPLSFEDHLAKVEKVKNAKSSHGIKAIALTTTLDTSGSFDQDDFDLVWILAQAEGLDAAGWGTLNFSASGADNAVMPYREPTNTYELLTLKGSNSNNETDDTVTRDSSSGEFTIDYTNQTFSLD